MFGDKAFCVTGPSLTGPKRGDGAVVPLLGSENFSESIFYAAEVTFQMKFKEAFYHKNYIIVTT